jgi:nicotinamidase-related amidase
MKHALIVIDMQQGAFIDAPPKHDAAALIERLNRLAGAVRAHGGSVIFIQHEGPLGDAFHPDSPGWKLLEALDVRREDAIISKRACDSFLKTALEAHLRATGSQRLIVTGWATDYCVDTTVRSALARGYPTLAPSDGHTCADRPHLPATKIVEHHNAIWADFISPAGPATVVPCAEVRLD